MARVPRELTLSLVPCSRYDAIDVTARVAALHGDALAEYRRLLFCSMHTTAGYLEQSLSSRLGHARERVDPYMAVFARMFPPEAGYRHDALELRSELSPEQRRVEPRNADSHLAFIASGLRNCVTYANQPGRPVYFIDLDGVCGSTARTRTTSVIGYDDEEVVANFSFPVPVSRHPVDAVNLADPRIGLLERAEEVLRAEGVESGRIEVALPGNERDAALAVNEYESLLMRHDLAEVLEDPLKFLARSGRNALADPRAVPSKSLGYARYDLVLVLNALIEALGLSQTALERLLARLLALPAARLLRLKRALSFVISSSGRERPAILRGTYQSPILLQWRPADSLARSVEVRLSRLV